MHNLPLQLTSFIGRQRELEQIKPLLLDDTAALRLLTLTGPGGCGKTRLALRLAAEVEQHFPDGAWWVELAGLSDPSLTAYAVGSALGIREASGRGTEEMLLDYLRSRALLLILDNCEHLIVACARLAEALLRNCAGLRLLATSREPLHIPGEITWPVPSLTLPEPQPLTEQARADALQNEAIRLFSERAQAVQPAFHLTADQVPLAAQICRRLDGLPLAIELAAARVRVLPVEQIATHLDDTIALLSTGSRTALPRQQTLRAAIGWSYDLLSEAERVLFRRLSVFAGSFSLEAAETVVASCELRLTSSGIGNQQPTADSAFEVLAHLVEKSLVQAQPGSSARYRLLETIRQYAAALLDPAEAEMLRQAHAAYALAYAETIAPDLSRAGRQSYLDQLADDHDNLRAALQWMLTSGAAEPAQRLSGALWWFWFHSGFWSEGRDWLARALALPPAGDVTIPVRARALLGAGVLAWAQGDRAAARSQLEQCVDLAYRGAEGHDLGYALQFLSAELLYQGRLENARAYGEQAIAFFRSSGEQEGLGLSLTNCGIVAMARKDMSAARALFEEGAATLRACGDRWGLALPLRNLGYLAFLQGDYERAEQLQQASLESLRDLGEKWFISRSIELLAETSAALGAHRRAVLLLGASEALREAVGAPLVPFYRAEFERAVAISRAALTEERFLATWQTGRSMPLNEMVEYALQPREQPSLKPRPAAPLQLNQQPSSSEALRSERLASLCLYALGSPRVYREGQLISTAEWTYARPRELLFFLLSHTPQTKEQIGLALWPDASPAQLRTSLHTTLHHLRRALGRPDWIIFRNGRYGFNRTLDYWYDVEAFEQALDQAGALADQQPEEALQLIEQALKLYQGDFLEQSEDSEWHLPRREKLQRRYLSGLIELGRLHSAAGRYPHAVERYRQALALDHLLEAAHRELMRCYARMGERGQALRHYQHLREILWSEIGAEPDRESIALSEAIRRGAEI